MQRKRKVKEKKLVDFYLGEQFINLAKHENDIIRIITNLGFALEDIEYRERLNLDILILGLASDSRALFNILEKSQAERMFRYLCFEAFNKYVKNSIEYISGELLQYRDIILQAEAELVLPDDHMYSKLLSNILRDKISKYNINSFDLMQIMQLEYIFEVRWKKILDSSIPKP